MIEAVELNCGPVDGAAPLRLEGQAGVTLFVGPNNCGKTALLEAIHYAFSGSGHSPQELKKSALKKVRLHAFENKILDDHPALAGKEEEETVFFPRGHYSRMDFSKMSPRQWNEYMGGVFREPLCVWMNGAKRLAMLPAEEGADLQSPSGPLARLLTDDTRRKGFQTAAKAGIDYYPVIDTVSRYGTLKLAFASAAPDAETERSLNKSLIDYLKTALPAEHASDGFNAYTGMLGALHASDFKVILIDEPEAFLHPTLARTLGRQVAEKAGDKQVYIATHSADFLMGAVESGVPIRIVRLQYHAGVSTARLLDNDTLRRLMNDPMMRSANVLSGLFAQAVVVTEADADRAFYQEINNRLLSAKDPRGIDNALFLNAHEKSTVPRLVEPLRHMGVPTIGIVDLDVLAEGGENWAKQMRAVGVPEVRRRTFETARQSVFELLRGVSTDGKQKNYKQRGGVTLLSGGEKDAAEALLSDVEDYGLLVVSQGELESWLSNIEVDRDKHGWLRSIFDALGSDPNDANYVKPGDADVWGFLGRARSWFADPARKGMVFEV
ncbi:AAA family ATPase [Ruegeria marisflavi]|uniref:AAA family ATPase n=1 Tax=Ruegeria marisflavi TaxID=2984152 RepID=UPI0021E0AB77|nr:ATP-binding protein [Ruegeria sp. WL0004]